MPLIKLNKINKVPMLWLTGSEDVQCQARKSRRYAEAMTDADITLVNIKGGNHWTFKDNADKEILEQVKLYLDNIEMLSKFDRIKLADIKSKDAKKNDAKSFEVFKQNDQSILNFNGHYFLNQLSVQPKKVENTENDSEKDSESRQETTPALTNQNFFNLVLTLTGDL